MTLELWAEAALRAALYTFCIYAALWFFSGHDHHPAANWFIVGVAFVIGFADGHRTSKRGAAS